MPAARTATFLALLLSVTACGGSDSGGNGGSAGSGGGGTPEVLAQLPGFDGKNDRAPFGVALDSDYVYVSVFKADADTASVIRLPKAGGTLENLSELGASSSSLTVSSGQIYFDDDGTGAILSVASGGGSVTELSPDSSATQLMLDGGEVIFCDANVGGTGLVATVPVGGGELTKLFEGLERPVAFDLHGDTLWIGQLGPTSGASEEGSLIRIPRGGGAETQVGPDFAGVRGVVADADRVFISVEGTGTADGEIVAVDATTGAETVLASGQSKPWGLVSDQSTLYWVNRGQGSGKGSVMKIAKSGGVAITLASAQSEPRQLAVDDSYVYWANFRSGEIARIAK